MPAFRRTRIAPTPSGFLHPGNILSFAVTATLARRTGAAILLRIDDMDQERVEPAYLQDIFDTLHFLNIPWDEGPANITSFEREYSQLHRMPQYRAILQQLQTGGHVFACECSRAQIARGGGNGVYPGTCAGKGIPLDRENVSWRLFTDASRELSVRTPGGNFTKAFLPPEMQMFIVRKKDGFPAYQLSSVADDLYFDVDLIVRGADLWPSTLAQLYLSTLLEKNPFPQTTFHHHTLLAQNGAKLSKTAGDISIRYLRQAGKRPEDIYSIIGTMLGYEEPVRDCWGLGERALLTLP